jgi:plasmid maintenance system antidote protein VapI
MNDVELLQQWMVEHGFNMRSLSREMGIHYITLYHMIVRRHTITDNFIIHFIQHFGCDEAVRLFSTRLSTTSNV